MTAWKLIVIIGNAVLVLAWPIGCFVGLELSKGSDPAGRGYAQIGGILATLLFAYLPVIIAFAIVGSKYWHQIKGWYRFLLFSPVWIVLCFILIAGAVAIYVALD